eukprot:2361453-Amphidinium_carterae.1
MLHSAPPPAQTSNLVARQDCKPTALPLATIFSGSEARLERKLTQRLVEVVMIMMTRRRTMTMWWWWWFLSMMASGINIVCQHYKLAGCVATRGSYVQCAIEEPLLTERPL